MYMNGLKSAATYNGIEKLLVYVIRKSNDVYGVKYLLWTLPKNLGSYTSVNVLKLIRRQL